MLRSEPDSSTILLLETLEGGRDLGQIVADDEIGRLERLASAAPGGCPSGSIGHRASGPLGERRSSRHPSCARIPNPTRPCERQCLPGAASSGHGAGSGCPNELSLPTEMTASFDRRAAEQGARTPRPGCRDGPPPARPPAADRSSPERPPPHRRGAGRGPAHAQHRHQRNRRSARPRWAGRARRPTGSSPPSDQRTRRGEEPHSDAVDRESHAPGEARTRRQPLGGQAAAHAGTARASVPPASSAPAASGLPRRRRRRPA